MRATVQLPRSGWFSVMLTLAGVALVIGVLHWARQVLIPLALSMLLTFLLAPIVITLRRRGMGRTFSVTVTVGLTFALLAGIGTAITIELGSLANELPKYRENIRQKIADVRLARKGGAIAKVQQTLKEVVEEIKKDEPGAAKSTAAVPVVVTDGAMAFPWGTFPLGAMLEPLASAGLVVVLVIFMLLRREDLRDRLLRLAGYGRLAATTKAIDEAAKRVSKYLLRQCLVNAGFGVGIGTGLFFVGLPYAILWGFLAAVARFIPYVGAWLAALAPILMSLAVFESWTAPLVVVVLVLGLELITSLVVEPLLYGQSIGVSEVALLIMMAFWTWLWGPIGLVLAAPLTVCLLVMSKSVDDLQFIGHLLSSEPALDRHQVFYQRLIAKDGEEAEVMVEAHLKQHSRAELFEQLLIPTLLACRRDYEEDRLNQEDKAFVFRAIRRMVERGEKPDVAKNGGSEEPITADRARSCPARLAPPLILGCPANDEADELALLMLAELLRVENWTMQVLSAQLLSSESLAEVEKARPLLVCLGVLGPGPLLPLRQFCKRVRARSPELPMVVGRWGASAKEQPDEQMTSLVDAIGWALTETKNLVIQLAKVSPVAIASSEERLAVPRATAPV